MVVVTPKIYEKMGESHVKNDKEIGWNELKKHQRIMNGNSRSLAKIFNIGEARGPRDQERCFDNTTSQAHHVPIMRCSPKTHKPPGKDGVPPSRPIVGADVGITTQGSEILYTTTYICSQSRT